MNKSNIIPLPKFYDRYIHIVEEENLLDALEASLEVLENIDWDIYNAIGKQVYSENKWTLNEVYQHLLDNERVQAYRILRIGRNDLSDRMGYDENAFADNSNANKRTLKDIVAESILIRKTSLMMIQGLNRDMLHQKANCSGIEISGLALGFQIVGHQIHHLNVIKERYYPLVTKA
jgi:hypothetical protein